MYPSGAILSRLLLWMRTHEKRWETQKDDRRRNQIISFIVHNLYHGLWQENFNDLEFSGSILLNRRGTEVGELCVQSTCSEILNRVNMSHVSKN